MHVLIVGAGCTGLLIAQGLRKRGISASVFERASVDRPPRDWSIMVHWGSQYMQDLLPDDVFARLDDAETDPWSQTQQNVESNRPIWNGKTGKPIAFIKTPNFKRYSRRRLCQILVRNVDVQWEKQLTGIALVGRGVIVTFADGSSASGDVVVGTDSANSRVRSWLFDDAPFAQSTDLPLIVYNFSTRYADRELARSLRDHPHRLHKVSTHPDHLTWYMIALLEVGDLDKPEEWLFQHFLTHWSEDELPSLAPEERLAHFKRLGLTYAEPFRSAMVSIDDQTFLPYDRLKHWASPRPWNNRGGRVTLAGDAAHPFPPHRAQGLNNAIQDAAHFVRAMAKVSGEANAASEAQVQTELASEVEAYDKELFERGTIEMRASVQQAYDATHMGRLAGSSIVTHGHGPLAQGSQLLKQE